MTHKVISHHTRGIVPPIFVFDPPDVIAFATVGAAESYLEPVDIENGVYLGAYDSEGRELALRVQPALSRVGRLLGHRRAQVHCCEEQPSHQSDLRSLMLAHLSGHTSMDNADLHTIVEAMIQRVGLVT